MYKSARLSLLALFVATPALADNWGTLDEAKVCLKEVIDAKTWQNVHVYPYAILGAMKDDAKVTADCKAEITKRVPLCAANKIMVGIFNSLKAKNAGMTLDEMCAYRAFGQIGDQLYPLVKAKEAELAKAKQQEALQAKIAQTDLPKPSKRDASLEKQIAAAYKATYPDNKVLKVIIVSGDWSTERSGFGVITGRTIQAVVVNKHPDATCELHSEGWWQDHPGKSFSGKLSPRGAGSMEKNGILCTKVK